MAASAGVRRVMGLIVAIFALAGPVWAQNQANRVAEPHAEKPDRSTSKETGAASTAEEARKKKLARAKAARDKRVSEIRKEAKAQHARALARLRVEEKQAAEEQEMLERERQEAAAAEANEKIRRLIEEAEAARLRAEQLLAGEGGLHSQRAAGPPPGLQKDAEALDQAREASERNKREAARASEHRRRLSILLRIHEVRKVRLAREAHRAVQEAEGRRVREAEAARIAHERARAMRAVRTKLAHAVRSRQARAAAEARRIAEAAETKRLAALEHVAELARLEAQAGRDRSKLLDTDRRAEMRDPKAERYGPAGREEPRSGRRNEEPGESELDRFVTVLLIMAPGDYGIRRRSNIADPVLCTIDGCYISGGADNLAIFLPRGKALGFSNTLGRRAGACRHSLSCAFRGVALDRPGLLQPVDLHVLKHDRRRPMIISRDSDCQLLAGRLICANGYYAEDYVLWVVPERLANEAGPMVLQRALRDDLASPRSAEAPSHAPR